MTRIRRTYLSLFINEEVGAALSSDIGFKSADHPYVTCAQARNGTAVSLSGLLEKLPRLLMHTLPIAIAQSKQVLNGQRVATNNT